MTDLFDTVVDIRDSLGARKIEQLASTDQMIFAECINGSIVSYKLLQLGETYSIIESYKAYTGITNAFEYIEFTLKVKELESRGQGIYRSVEGSEVGELFLIPGRSHILMKGRVCGTYVVSNVKISNETYTIRAYTQFETIRSKVYTSGNVQSVFDMFGYALTRAGISSESVISNVIRYQGSKWVSIDDNLIENNGKGDRMYIQENTYLWRILQLCAIHMGWKIWFTGKYMYIINFQDKDQAGIQEMGNIMLHTDRTSKDDVWACASDKLTSPTNNSESQRTSFVVTYHPRNGGKPGDGIEYAYSVDGSVVQTDNVTPLDLPEYADESSARHFCIGAVKYTKEVSKTARFTLNERVITAMRSETNRTMKRLNIGGIDLTLESPTNTIVLGYERNILDPARATSVTSAYNSVCFTNKNPNGVNNRLNLILTSTELNYPEGESIYTFGENKDLSLDSSLSEIRSS